MRKTDLPLALSLLLGLSSCAVQAPVNYPYAPAESDRLVVYTSHKEEVYGPIVKEFQERTGIWTEVVPGGTNELLERIQSESDAPVCDVMFGGGVESLSAYPDCFQPYTCADADLLRPGLVDPDGLWTPFSTLPIVLVYNTKLVSPGQLTSWRDLLDPRWKGKIALADPTVSGSSYTAVLTLLSSQPGDDWAVLEGLVDNLDGTVLAGSGDVVEQVAAGSLFVGVTLEETALKRLAQGADIALVYPTDGTSDLPDGSALIAGAPHPDNAKAFLEFVQSRDVQELVVEQFSRRPVRTDVDDPADLPPVGDFPVLDYDVAWASGLKDAFTQRWQALLEEAAP